MCTEGKFSCFIIGTQSHVVRCAEILLQRGHRICGIISSGTLIAGWAREEGISHIDLGSDLTNVLSRQPFDYLFSITHFSIISSEMLALPRKGAINFHDGPLPRYAGLYATSWALINQEKTHGVTWHMMASEVDKGDILKQRSVDIVEGDTAFTINVKCYEACIDSFAELVDELASGRVESRKQRLTEATYFSKHERPPAACTLSWGEPADRIAALVRALDFGPYINPLGLPKLVMGDEIFIVPEIEVLDVTSQVAPGTITAVSGDSLKVATASNEVALGNLRTIDGQPLSVAGFVARFGLRKGDRLAELGQETSDHVTALNSAFCRHEPFWVNRLEKLEPVELPYANHSLAPTDPLQYAAVPMSIPAEVNTILADYEDVANRSDFLVAAFVAYLARISSNYSFDLGFSHPALQQEVVGVERFFATHVPMCVELDPSERIGAALDALQAELALVKKHKTYARDTILRYPELGSLRAYGDKSPWSIVVEQVEGLNDYTPLPGSALALLLSKDGTECRWVYATAVLDQDSIAGIQCQFTTFLRNVVADGDCPVAEISLLTEAEYHQLVIEWNDTQVDYPIHLCIHQLFEAQVERTPDAVAVSFEGQDLTYRALNRRANQLAHHLQRLGVGPEVLVGVFMERSLEMVVGLYAILKAGGAYVPLDPEFPKERVAYMLDHSQVSVLLTQQRLKTELAENGARVICLDTDWKEISQESEEIPAGETRPENLAYVMYTSGSTGKPKGVQVPHRAVVNFLDSMQREPGLTEQDVLLAVTTLSFDISVLELFLPLTVGARTVIVSRDIASDGKQLLKALESSGGTVMQATPTTWRLLIAAGWEGCDRLRVLCGGEAMPGDLARELIGRAAGVWNMYGPTETTVWSTCYHLTDPEGLILIGRPIANTQIYILDNRMQPVPVGVSGEIHIGGAGVARGYLKQSDMTTERFVPDPFSKGSNARLYNTGDLGRYLRDGNIEYLCRTDNQVKVRGFRIELGEIEATLIGHPDVREVVVAAREDAFGNTRLIGYIVPVQGEKPAVESLRSFLQDKLPRYMVPEVFVTLKALPLTPNGKIDRKALPEPDQTRPEMEQVYVPPSTGRERTLTDIWCQVLGLDHVGVHDNFFDLGGNSLLSVQVVARVQQALEIDISVIKLFQFPTISSLAEYLNQYQSDQPSYQKAQERAHRRKVALSRQRRRAK